MITDKIRATSLEGFPKRRLSLFRRGGHYWRDADIHRVDNHVVDKGGEGLTYTDRVHS